MTGDDYIAGFKIISDSSCDLSAETLDKYGIGLVPYYIAVDGKNFKRDFYEITNKDFYHTLRTEKVYPKTSLPPIQDYIDSFTEAFDNGQDILCICLTSKFSGSYQSAHNAKNILHETYPERNIVIIDSMLCTFGQGMLVTQAVELRTRGYSLAETGALLDKIKPDIKIVFTVQSLDYLQRGGRIGKVSLFAGMLLNIQPIINVQDGELIPCSKVRGHKKALIELVNIILKGVSKSNKKHTFALVHSDMANELEPLREILAEKHITLSYPDSVIGCTIGTHIGPTVMGVACIPDLDEYLSKE